MTEAPDKLPPHSQEAEAGVLGCVMTDPNCINDCVVKFKAGVRVFYMLSHQAIYHAMLQIHEAGKTIDVITLFQKLKDEGTINECGGIQYVSSLPDVTPSPANLGYYADIVMEKYVLRKLLGTVSEVALRVSEYEGDLDPLLDEVERCFMEVGNERHMTREKSGQEFIQPAISRIENYHRGHAQMIGISSGYEYLDGMTCGFADGQLIVIAARPGLGKTSLALNFVERMALDKKIPCGVFSLEMTDDELGARLLFQVAGADYQRFRTGYFENVNIPGLVEAAKRISLAPLWIDSTSSMTILELRSKARRMSQLYGIKVLVIDYLQLLSSSREYGNREQEVAEISTGLKSLAKELKIPVIVLAQLNRDVEKDPNRKPRLADLRESGRIEADADLVAMLYQPKLKEDERAALDAREGSEDWSKRWSRVNLLIAKQRNGPTGDFEMEFFKASMRFEAHHRPPKKVVITTEPMDE